MITLWRWGRGKPKTSVPRENGAVPIGETRRPNAVNVMPSPVLRWVANGRVALRTFNFEADAEAVCAFQPETYQLNFPDFNYTPAFAQAFRHDLRRAGLDPCNGLFVLDDASQ